MKKIVGALFVASFCFYVLLHKGPTPARRFVRGLYEELALNVVDSVCKATLYPNVCFLTLHALNPQTTTSGGSIKDMAIVSLEVSLQEVQKLSMLSNDEISHGTIEDCGTLFESSLRHLNGSLEMLRKSGEWKKEQADDVKTWLSASLTDLDTCKQPFEALNTRVTKLVSNSLAIVNLIPVLVGSIHRRLLSEAPSLEDGFPSWLSPNDRRLLQSPPGGGVAADVVVAADGTGNYKTISEAVEGAPSKSNGRYVIHVKAGVYTERVTVSKDNIMLIGDGKDASVVSGSKSGSSLKSIPTFAATGKGFIARDIGFENTAGANDGQAIALRAASDQSVYYRCSLKSYQDTLYAYSLRQFYRECDIYGSVDFIFGNAAAVFQSCNIISRQRGGGSANYITAHGRTDPNQNTGFSIDECKVTGSMRTYLGRPWKQYARTVFMQSYLDGSIDPAGWSEWSGSSSTKTVYYGEYMNNGPGAGAAKRVQWPGYHIISTAAEATKFTVAELISGNSWLPSTGVAFRAGLIS
ncbi:hypothetical protein SUGI_0004140 [Cryptomeria japonica]|uniref:pectinesterase n=1 Tax=Cryptomeria japonica TaxID=3369 RepID=UPI002408D262|nr:pectinesterase [Cryptomeria japonica]GLJ04817.1 hypothetical protein SUGI_0004140 [Cryptomeria japonica]